jgi:hypothetical protein
MNMGGSVMYIGYMWNVDEYNMFVSLLSQFFEHSKFPRLTACPEYPLLGSQDDYVF